MRFAEPSRRPRLPLRRLLLGVGLLAFLAAGLAGTSSYWQAYYKHRGFTRPARLRQARPGRVETIHFYSPALGREADYLVFLPPGYSPADHYPAFYLLHGSPGNPQLYLDVGNIDVRLENLIGEGRAPPMILVFPDARVHGSSLSDSEWANGRYGRYENYVLDVVRNVDLRFAAIPERQDRVIGGYSEGGYGALNIAVHHLGVFGSVQVWSGYFDQPHRWGPFRHATLATLAYNSPDKYVLRISRRLRELPLRVFMYVGRRDPAKVLFGPMAAELTARGAYVSWTIYKGGHDWQLWNAHMDHMLVLAGRDVRLPLVPRPPALPLLVRVSPRLLPQPARVRRPLAPRHTVRARRPAPYVRPLAGLTPRVLPAPTLNVFGVARHSGGVRGSHQPSFVLILFGLLLALASAAAINLGFLLQHRGLSTTRSLRGRPTELAAAVLKDRSWLGGQALGWLGFLAQIVAVSIAPLALVQSFAAGGLALSVPLAAGLFGHRITRRQGVAVLVVAVALAVLPIGMVARADHIQGGGLALATAGLLALALAFAPTELPASRAIAAGLFYGVADVAIKAIAVGWGSRGAGALDSGWTLLAAASTFAGFLCFQSALRRGSAVTAITLMNCLAALAALAAGVLAFQESLGRSPGVTAVHALAVAVVLGCVPVLAAAQTELAENVEPPEGARQRAAGGEQRGLEPWTYPRPAG